MKYSKIVAAIAVGALGVMSAFTSASAQNTANNQLLSSAVMHKISATDVAGMMGDFGIQTELTAYSGGDIATVVATTSGGARFFVSLMVCDDASTATGCERLLIFTALSNAGMAYEDLNTFNGNADATTAVNVAGQNIIMFGARVFSRGGIGQDNFKLHTALFLNDMQNFVNGQAASAASVSFNAPPKMDGKLDNLNGAQAAAENPPLYRAGLEDHALSGAIANTWKVRFLSDEVEAALN